ncbi:putative membrane protein [Helicobacter pylori Hp H-3]|nr:putative membrane protein [Helicobacter pylori Hp H-3]
MANPLCVPTILQTNSLLMSFLSNLVPSALSWLIFFIHAVS